MIRINLLGTAKPKKGKRKLFVMPQITTAGPSPLITGLAMLVVSGAALYLDYLHLQSKHQQLQARLATASTRIASMAKVKQAYLERQKDYDVFKRRYDVIDQLRNQQDQATPVPLMGAIRDTVDKTDGVWLLNMKDDGGTVSLDGVALGPTQLAALMTNLRGSGFFKNVELKDASQEDKQTLQTFSFTLICDKAKA